MMMIVVVVVVLMMMMTMMMVMLLLLLMMMMMMVMAVIIMIKMVFQHSLNKTSELRVFAFCHNKQKTFQVKRVFTTVVSFLPNPHGMKHD